MEIKNDTPFEDGLIIGMGTDRRPCAAVVVKGTFVMPKGLDGLVEVAEVAEEQQPVLASEEYHNGDVTGSLLFDADTAPFKPCADVVLVGQAYAPQGRPAGHVDVLLEVGPLRKALRVFGNRHWLFPSRAVMIPVISPPEAFTEMPLRYELAFGGIDRKGGKWCDKNFIGKGFLGKKSKASVDGKPLPNIEDPARLITSWDDEPSPAGYGFYNAAWQPRVGYGGTEKGLEQPHPLFGLAADFNHAYYNSAHPDLQAPGYLRGDEEVDLINLTRDGRRRFRLPGVRPTITLSIFTEASETPEQEGLAARSTETHLLDAALDTLVLLPDAGLFYQVWRGVYPLPDLEAGLDAIAEIDIQMADAT